MPRTSKLQRKDSCHKESILIVGGRILNPATNLDTIGDIAIEDGVVIALGTAPSHFSPQRIIQAKGMWVAPGLLDLHTHLREPGREDQETIDSGTAAAAAGGFTAITALPSTDPVTDNEQKVLYIIRQNRGGYCKVYPMGSITKKLEGKELSPYDEMMSAGAKAVVEDGISVKDSSLLKNAFTYAKMLKLPVFAHCEDSNLAKGAMNESSLSTRIGVRGTPSIAEDIDVARHIMLAEYLTTSVHICQVSTVGAIQQIRYAKKRGVAVTAETATHYFSFDQSAIEGYHTNFKLNPPLRGTIDKEAIIEALADGTLDAIATNHASHTLEEKEGEFDLAENGVVGLETAVAAGITNLVHPGHITPLQLIDKMSTTPHRILQVSGGIIAVGGRADITIIDPSIQWTVAPSDFYTKGRCCAYEGTTLTGEVQFTINGGRVIFEQHP